MIRVAGIDDVEGILEIYTPIVQATAISFELEPPSHVDMQQRIRETLEMYPWLVDEQQGRILGYAYATAHRTRAAYQWSVDVSIYVHRELRRAGVGRRLYQALFTLLRSQGYYTAYAGIALPNPASVGLHEAMGFTSVGVYREVGFKLGQWHDVGWWQLTLQPKPAVPRPPIPFSDIQTLPDGEEVLRAAFAER